MSRVIPIIGNNTGAGMNFVEAMSAGQLIQLTSIGDETNGLVITDLCFQFFNYASVAAGQVEVAGVIFGSQNGTTNIVPIQTWGVIFPVTGAVNTNLALQGYAPIFRNFGSGLILGANAQLWMKVIVFNNVTGMNMMLDVTGYVF